MKFDNVIINENCLNLKVNSYGVLRQESEQSYLGYFQFDNNYNVQGVVEIRESFYNFLFLDNRTVIVIAERNEKVILRSRKIIGKYKPRILLKKAKFTKICTVKVILGPFMYNLLSAKILFKTEREKLLYIKNYIALLFINVNMIFSKLNDTLDVIFLVKQLILVTPKVCNESFQGYLYLSPIKELCDINATADEILDSFEGIYFDNMFCLVVSLISHEPIVKTLGYANIGTMCRYIQFRRVLFANFVGNRFIFNPKLSSLVMAHEIAHTFNAGHDDETPCKTSGTYNYIMNSKFANIIGQFSTCSIEIMRYHILIFEARECFSDRTTPFCGNGILEEGEQCDCGNMIECFCCNKAICMYQRNVVCSPFGRHGVCCDYRSCKWKKRSLNITCNLKTFCSQKMFCHEDHGCQPDSGIANTLCARNSKVCVDGVCKTSICSLWNLTEYPSYKVSNRTCLMHCLNTSTGVFLSISDLPPIAQLNLINSSKIFYTVGSKCMNEREFCKFNGECSSLEGKVMNEMFLSLFLNPFFYGKLSTIFHTCYIWIIIFLILVDLLIIFLFQIPYLRDKINIYSLQFRGFSSSASIIEYSNYISFQLFLRREFIRTKFSKPEIEEITKELTNLQIVQNSFNFALGKQFSLPVNGKLVHLKDQRTMNALKKLF